MTTDTEPTATTDRRRPEARPPAQPPAGAVRPGPAEGRAAAGVRHAPAGHPVEEPGDVRGRGRHRPVDRLHGRQGRSTPARRWPSLGYLIALDVWLFLTVLFANFAEALAEARGKAQADALRKTRQETPAHPARATRPTSDAALLGARPRSSRRADGLDRPAGRRPGRRRGRAVHPRRRRDHRRRRVRRRVGHHRRVGPGRPRGRRRPLRRHRRHARAVRPHRRPHHGRRPGSRSSTA